MRGYANQSLPARASDDVSARHFCSWRVLVLTLGCVWTSAPLLGNEAVTHFKNNIQPILAEYCYDCHGDGMNKGGIAFDELKTDEAVLNHDLWLKVLKNLRPELMPPQKKPRPPAEQQKRLEQWIKYEAFGLDPKNPDPGRVTVRRLNRIEYRNTIRDLMGIDFNTEVEFPPDDTGYGFDVIGDVLTVSPMLLEKYLAASKAIVAEAVPTVSRVIPEKVIAGARFRGATGDSSGEHNRKDSMLSLSYYEPAAVSNVFNAAHEGTYRLTLELNVKGAFDFDPSKCTVVFSADGQERLRREFGWNDNKRFSFEFREKWLAGEHQLALELVPQAAPEAKRTKLELRIVSLVVQGPLEERYRDRPKNYERFFTRDAPQATQARRQYAREVLGRFATKAFRRPADDKTVGRLVALAESVYGQPGKTFEAGIAHAMVAVLSSPRFLFRLEESQAASSPPGGPALIDEFSLASRLSYFLWSTMPDDDLFRMAERGELRSNLQAQVTRMLADPRSEAMIRNFTGQWLQTRDVEGVSINARVVLARDSGGEKELHRQQEEFHALLAQREAQARRAAQTNAPGQTNLQAQANPERPLNRPRFFQPPSVELDTELRLAMQRETELFVGSIVREDRSVTELIESDYTFLNEKLANFYGLSNLNVTGAEMRRVALPPDNPRGGVLTDGSVLVVTSNPDRTSPVKRGLFILDNVLNTPPPPPPQDVPLLDEAEKEFQDHEPTLREALEMHRHKPLCASCHARMDPIGLAFENFNAMGMWREMERNQPIDTAGRLITGETFNSVRELKHILVTQRRMDFYRCLTEKLLTYALGRGMEYYDAETMDQIVERLERENGRFSALLMGIIESAPFQKQRNPAALASAKPAQAADVASASEGKALKR